MPHGGAHPPKGVQPFGRQAADAMHPWHVLIGCQDSMHQWHLICLATHLVVQRVRSFCPRFHNTRANQTFDLSLHIRLRHLPRFVHLLAQFLLPSFGRPIEGPVVSNPQCILAKIQLRLDSHCQVRQ